MEFMTRLEAVRETIVVSSVLIPGCSQICNDAHRPTCSNPTTRWKWRSEGHLFSSQNHLWVLRLVYCICKQEETAFLWIVALEQPDSPSAVIKFTPPEEWGEWNKWIFTGNAPFGSDGFILNQILIHYIEAHFHIINRLHNLISGRATRQQMGPTESKGGGLVRHL